MPMEILANLEKIASSSIAVRLVLATLFGSLVGLERGAHGKSAGIRTFSLVCLGSALVMVTNEYLLVHFATGDPARLGAQVVSGVGFLGVGTIIVTGRNYVKGLTTAASLWATACLGIALGAGHIMGALVTLILMFFIMTVLSRVSRYTDAYVPTIFLYLEVSKDSGVDAVYDYAAKKEYAVLSVNRQQKLPLRDNDITLLLELNLKKRVNHAEVLDSIKGCEAIHYAEEVH